LTLTLRALLGQDMTGEGLLVLEASGGFLEPLGSSALGFHLRHFLKLRILFLSKTIVPLNDKSPADAGDPSQDQVHFFLRGATVMFIGRPSIVVRISAVASSSSSCPIRSRSFRAMSWWATSRPRKRIVILPRSPFSRNRARLRSFT